MLSSGAAAGRLESAAGLSYRTIRTRFPPLAWTGNPVSDPINKVSSTDSSFHASKANAAHAPSALGGLNAGPTPAPSARQWVAASMRLAADLAALAAPGHEPADGLTP